MKAQAVSCALVASLLVLCACLGSAQAAARSAPTRKLKMQEQNFEWWSSEWCEGDGCPPANGPAPPPANSFVPAPPPGTNGQNGNNGFPANSFVPAPPAGTNGAPPAGTGQGGPCPDIQAVLDLHNRARAARGAQPLTWSDSLASAAAAWSGQCNRDQTGYSHDNFAGFGENLAWFENRGDQCGTGVQSWLEEERLWSPSNPMNFGAGHWTQMVWKESTQVGCGIALCRQGQWGPEYLVTCRYTPPGNFGGAPDWARNV